METTASKYPMLDRVADAHERGEIIDDFLDWLGDQGITLRTMDPETAHWDFPRYFPVKGNRYWLIERFFGVDHRQVEVEREALLRTLRP